MTELTKAEPEIDYAEIVDVLEFSKLKPGDLIVIRSEYPPPFNMLDVEATLREALQQAQLDFLPRILSMPLNYDIEIMPEEKFNKLGYYKEKIIENND